MTDTDIVEASNNGLTISCLISDPKYEWGFDDLGGVSVPVAMQANGTWKDPSGDNVAVSTTIHFFSFLVTSRKAGQQVPPVQGGG